MEEKRREREQDGEAECRKKRICTFSRSREPLFQFEQLHKLYTYRCPDPQTHLHAGENRARALTQAVGRRIHAYDSCVQVAQPPRQCCSQKVM